MSRKRAAAWPWYAWMALLTVVAATVAGIVYLLRPADASSTGTGDGATLSRIPGGTTAFEDPLPTTPATDRPVAEPGATGLVDDPYPTSPAEDTEGPYEPAEPLRGDVSAVDPDDAFRGP